MNPRRQPTSIRLVGAVAAVAAGLWAGSSGALAQQATGLSPAAPVPGSTAIQASDADGLIPAAFGIWTDRGGSSWSVEAGGNIGRIGSAMVNGGLALLVNEEKFAPHQPMMTRDGKELVIQGLPFDGLPGFRVQRRVRLLDEPGGLRYAELVHNDSSDPLSVSIGLTTNFSGNFKTFLSDRGRAEPLILSPAETAVMVLPGASQSSRAFLFTLADLSAPVRPTLSSQNRYGLTFRFQLDLGPGESAALVHHVAQVVIPQRFDRRTLQALSLPFSFERIRSSFGPDWSPFIVNATTPPTLSVKALFEGGGVAALGLGARSHDLLAAGEATRLNGKAEGGPIRLRSEYGEGEFGLDRVAAIAGGGAGKGEGGIRLFLRDGQVLAGQAEATELFFLPTVGERQPIDPATLDRLAMAGAPEVPTWPEDAVAIAETVAGERIKLPREDSINVRLATPWGEYPVALKDLVWIGPAPGGLPGHRVELSNGTSLNGVLAEGDLEVQATEFGDIRFESNRLKYLFTKLGVVRKERGLPAAFQSMLTLTGEQALVGKVSGTSLAMAVEEAQLDTAIAEIRRLFRLDPAAASAGAARWESARFRIERWDGGIVVGVPRGESLSVEVAGQTWQIPFRDLVSADFPSPDLDSETFDRIEALIRDLGSADWNTRESATRELGAFGYLARPVLRRELSSATDPEVERRLERILAGMN